MKYFHQNLQIRRLTKSGLYFFKKMLLKENQVQIGEQLLYRVQRNQIESSVLHRSIVAIRYPLVEYRYIYGSGVLISKNLVLTAAHNLYNVRQSKEMDKTKYQIYLNTDGEKCFKVQDWMFMDEYKQKDCIQYDYALIKLKDIDIPTYDSYLQLAVPFLTSIVIQCKMKLEIYGFPTKTYKNYHPTDKQGKKIQIFQYGLTRQTTSKIIQKYEIQYPISTQYGQSGCPVVADNKIIAVNINLSQIQQIHFGRLITQDLLKNIEKWKKELKGQNFKIHENECLHQISINRLREEQIQKKEEDKSLNCLKKIANIYLQQNNHSKASQFYNLIGNQYYEQEKYSEASQNYIIALEIYQLLKGEGSEQCFLRMGKICQIQEKFTEASQYYKSALSILDKKEEKKQPEYFECLKGLINAYLKQNNHPKALQLADTIYQMGTVYQDQQNNEKALEYFSLTLQIEQKVKGKGCFQSAITIHQMGLTYGNQKSYTNALESYTLALQIYERVSGKVCLQSAATIHNIGLTHYDQQNYEKALEYYTLTLQIYEHGKGKGCFQSAINLYYIGLVYRNQQNYAKALEYFTLTLQIYEKFKGKGCFQSVDTLHNMALVHYNQQNYSNALDYYILALQIQEKVKGKKCLKSAPTLHNMGLVYHEKQEYVKALEYYKQTQSIYKKHNIKKQNYAFTLFNMGVTYRSLKDYKAAAKAFQQSVNVYQANNLQSKVRNSAVELAKILKLLNNSSDLKQVMTKYGVQDDLI